MERAWRLEKRSNVQLFVWVFVCAERGEDGASGVIAIGGKLTIKHGQRKQRNEARKPCAISLTRPNGETEEAESTEQTCAAEKRPSSVEGREVTNDTCQREEVQLI